MKKNEVIKKEIEKFVKKCWEAGYRIDKICLEWEPYIGPHAAEQEWKPLPDKIETDYTRVKINEKEPEIKYVKGSPIEVELTKQK